MAFLRDPLGTGSLRTPRYRCIIALALAAGTSSAFEDAGQAALTRQREAAARQASAVMQQTAAVAEQQASVARQWQSAIRGSASGMPWIPRPASGLSEPAACDPLSPEALDPLIRETAAQRQLSPELIRAVIAQESAFRPCAVSAKGAMGLMQLMPETARWLGVVHPFDPRENIDSGARLLKMLLERYGGKLEQALAAYNAGPARVDQAGGIPPIAETQQYVPRVLNRLKP